MQSIDALGKRPERRAAFTRELLAETRDSELQTIVEEAARSLGVPISLVTLVLDHIQFFKAHYGLPADLTASRGTSRDVSFCQFVVRDDQAFVVSDATADERVPQHLVEEYGIRSYLGVPIHARGIVAGSLCAIDTEPRTFSEEDREKLAELGKRVDERLDQISVSRRQARLSLMESALLPAFSELQESLAAAGAATDAGRLAASAVSSFHRLAAHVLGGGSSPPGAVERSRAAAEEALEECENAFDDLETSIGDAVDSLLALQHLTSPAGPTQLSEVLIAAQELSRHSVRPVGGASLPDLSFDPEIHAPQSLAASILATCLTRLAARLGEKDLSCGIAIDVIDDDANVAVVLSAKELTDDDHREVASELTQHLGEEPAVSVYGADNALRVAFTIVPSSS